MNTVTGVTSEGSQSDQQLAGTSQNIPDDLEGREAEAATKSTDPQTAPQQIPTTGATARHSGRVGRPRAQRTPIWENTAIPATPQESIPTRGSKFFPTICICMCTRIWEFVST